MERHPAGENIINIVMVIMIIMITMMMMMMTDLGFLGQACGARERDRSCWQRDQPQAVQVAHHHLYGGDDHDEGDDDHRDSIILMMMIMKIYQVRSREADPVQGYELSHYGRFPISSFSFSYFLSPFHLLLVMISRLRWFHASR